MKLNLKAGKGNKIHIHVDGEYKMTVDSDFVSSSGLYENMQLNESELAELEEAVNSRRAFNKAVDLLSRRDHSSGELLQKLRQKGYADGAQEALEKLAEYGYIDNRRFAFNYASELVRLKGFGKRRVSQELFKKGVERQIIDEVLEEVEFESDTLLNLIERKYSKYLDSQKGVAKTINALLRMGYSYGEIKSALQSYETSLDDDWCE